MNKNQLYEKIMKCVSEQVKSTLNEHYNATIKSTQTICLQLLNLFADGIDDIIKKYGFDGSFRIDVDSALAWKTDRDLKTKYAGLSFGGFILLNEIDEIDDVLKRNINNNMTNIYRRYFPNKQNATIGIYKRYKTIVHHDWSQTAEDTREYTISFSGDYNMPKFNHIYDESDVNYALECIDEIIKCLYEGLKK